MNCINTEKWLDINFTEYKVNCEVREYVLCRRL